MDGLVISEAALFPIDLSKTRQLQSIRAESEDSSMTNDLFPQLD